MIKTRFNLLFLLFFHVAISCEKSPPTARSISLEAISSADDLSLTLRATVVGFSPSQVTLFEEGEEQPLGDMQPQPDGEATAFEFSVGMPEVGTYRFYAMGFGDGDDTTSNVVEVTVDTSTTLKADLSFAAEGKSAVTFAVTTKAENAAHAILYEVVDGRGTKLAEQPIVAGSQEASFGLTYTATDKRDHTYYVEIVDAQYQVVSRSANLEIEVEIPPAATSLGGPVLALEVVGAEGKVVTDADQEVKLVVTSENIALDAPWRIALFAESAEGELLAAHDAENGGTEFSLSFTYRDNGGHTYRACAEVGGDDPLCEKVTLEVNIPGVELALDADNGQRAIELDAGEAALLIASVYGTVAKIGLYYYEKGAEGDAQLYRDVFASGATTYDFTVGEELKEGATYVFFAVVYADANADTADFAARSSLAEEIQVTWKNAEKAETPVGSSWYVTLSAEGDGVVDGVVTTDDPVTLTATVHDLEQESAVAIVWNEGGQSIDESGFVYQRSFTHQDNGDHTYMACVEGLDLCDELSFTVDIPWVGLALKAGDDGNIDNAGDTVTLVATVDGTAGSSVVFVAGDSNKEVEERTSRELRTVSFVLTADSFKDFTESDAAWEDPLSFRAVVKDSRGNVLVTSSTAIQVHRETVVALTSYTALDISETIGFTLGNFGFVGNVQVQCTNNRGRDVVQSDSVALASDDTEKNVAVDFSSVPNGDYTCTGSYGSKNMTEISVNVGFSSVTLVADVQRATIGQTITITPTSRDGSRVKICRDVAEICSVGSGEHCSYALSPTDDALWVFDAVAEADTCGQTSLGTVEIVRQWVDLKVGDNIDTSVPVTDNVTVTDSFVRIWGVLHNVEPENLGAFTTDFTQSTSDNSLDSQSIDDVILFTRTFTYEDNGDYVYVLYLNDGSPVSELKVTVAIAHVELISTTSSVELSGPQDEKNFDISYLGAVDTIELHVTTSANIEHVVRRWDTNTQGVINNVAIHVADFASLVESGLSTSNFFVYAVAKEGGNERARSESVPVTINTATPFLTLAVVLAEADDGHTSAMVFPEDTTVTLRLTQWGVGDFCTVELCSGEGSCSDFSDNLEKSLEVPSDDGSVEYYVRYGLSGEGCVNTRETNQVTVYIERLVWLLFDGSISSVDGIKRSVGGDGRVTKFPDEDLTFGVNLRPVTMMVSIYMDGTEGVECLASGMCRYEFGGASPGEVRVNAEISSYDGSILSATSILVDVMGSGTTRTVRIYVPGGCDFPSAVKFVNGDKDGTGCKYELTPNGRNEIVLTQNVVLETTDNTDGETGTDTIKGNVDIRGESGSDTVIEVSGSGKVRPLRIGTDADVTFGDLRITNLIPDSDTSSYEAGRGGNYGGCIYNEGGVVTMNSVTVEWCSASYGGCIYNEGTLQMTDSTISHCSAASTDGDAIGGGIYNMGVIENISDTTLSDCSATSVRGRAYGGGICSNSGGKMVLNRVSLLDNMVGGSTEVYGGGLFVGSNYPGDQDYTRACPVELDDVKIHDNRLEVPSTVTEAGGGGIAVGTYGCVVGNSVSEIAGNQIKVTPASEDVSVWGGGVYNDGFFKWRGRWLKWGEENSANRIVMGSDDDGWSDYGDSSNLANNGEAILSGVCPPIKDMFVDLTTVQLDLILGEHLARAIQGIAGDADVKDCFWW